MFVSGDQPPLDQPPIAGTTMAKASLQSEPTLVVVSPDRRDEENANSKNYFAGIESTKILEKS